MGKFEDLQVWQKSKDLSVKVYRITSEGTIKKDFGLKDQIRRASVSVPSNIAEGDESGSNRLAVKYFYIAKGSLAELFTQIQIAREVGYLDAETRNNLSSDCKTLSSMLNNIIKIRSLQPIK
jgi:four helix bundle protein